MATATFDTLKFANTLKAAGFHDNQAEALAAAFADVVQVNFQDLVTKEDLAVLQTELDRVVKEVKSNLDRAAVDPRQELGMTMAEMVARVDTSFASVISNLVRVQWMAGVTLVGTVAILIKLFLIHPV